MIISILSGGPVAKGAVESDSIALLAKARIETLDERVLNALAVHPGKLRSREIGDARARLLD
jgi:hypothetical protein